MVYGVNDVSKSALADRRPGAVGIAAGGAARGLRPPVDIDRVGVVAAFRRRAGHIAGRARSCHSGRNPDFARRPARRAGRFRARRSAPHRHAACPRRRAPRRCGCRSGRRWRRRRHRPRRANRSSRRICEPTAAPASAPTRVPVFSRGPVPVVRIARAAGKSRPPSEPARSLSHNAWKRPSQDE